MDGVVITALIISAVIAVVKGLTLFIDSILKKRKENYYAVVPVFQNDKFLAERLMDLTERTYADIVLLDCDADSSQCEVCHNFCLDNKNAVFLNSSELEKYFSESFAINHKR